MNLQIETNDDSVTLKTDKINFRVPYSDLPLVIHILTDVLFNYHNNLVIPDENWLSRQMRIAKAEVQSWSTWKQNAMKNKI